MWLVAYFYHKTTRAPLVWWSPTVLLVNAGANSVVLNNQPMTEITAMPWAYYNSYELESSIDYIGLYDPHNTDYLPSVDKLFIPASSGWSGGWLTTEEHDKLMSITSWASFDVSGITGSIWKLNKSISTKIEEEHKKTRTLIETKDNETNSHIDVAKESIITTIGTIETDVDLTTVTEWIGVLKQRFTKLSDWLKTEQKKEMESKDMENEGKLSELQSKIDEMEEAFEEMQNLSKSELDEKQKLIEDMEETAKEIMEELEKEKVVNKEATEKEIKDKLISSLSE